MEYLNKNPILRIVLVLFAGLLASYVAFLAPLMRENKKLNRMIGVEERAIGELTDIGKEYSASRKILDELKSSVAGGGRGTSYATLLESLAMQVNIKEKITSMKSLPEAQTEEFSTVTIELKVQNVSLEELTNYVYRIENSPSWMLIRKITLKTRANEPEAVDALIQVTSFKTVQ